LVALLDFKAEFVAIIVEVKVHLNVFSFFLFFWVNFISKDLLQIFPNVKKIVHFHLLYFEKVNLDNISDIMKSNLHRINLQDFIFNYKNQYFNRFIHQ